MRASEVRMRYGHGTMRGRHVRRALGLTLVAAGCGETTEPLVPAAVAATTPTTQEAEVGRAVGAAPAVKVTAASGAPVPGVTVVFAVTAGLGSLEGATRTTDTEGVARVGAWKLGTVAGVNSVSASVAGLSPVVFTATAYPGPPAAAVVAPNGVRIEVGSFAQLTVTFRDAYGNQVSGPPVTWASSKPAVATVSDGGLVTGLVNGTATVTATSGGATGGTLVEVHGANSSLVNGDFEAADATLGWTVGGTRNRAVTPVQGPTGNALQLSVGSGPVDAPCGAAQQNNFVFVDQRFRMPKDRVVEIDFRVPVPTEEDPSETPSCPGWDRVEIDFAIEGTASPPWNATGVVLIDYFAATAKYQGHVQVNDFVVNTVASASFDPTAFSPVTVGPLAVTAGPTPGWLRASFDASTARFPWLPADVVFRVTLRIEDDWYTGRNSSVTADNVIARPK